MPNHGPPLQIYRKREHTMSIARHRPTHTIDDDVLVIDGTPVHALRGRGVIRIKPRTGVAFVLRKGECLRVIDPMGEQVSDLFAFDATDPREWLSSGRTIDYANRIYLQRGDILYSNRSSEMLEIVEDTSGGHDFLLTPCCQAMFEKLYGITEPRPSCFDNLRRNLGAFGIHPDQISTTLNIFMSVRPDARTGELTIGAPTSDPGDSATFLAQRDLIIGLTACSAEKSNNGSFKPIDFEVTTGGASRA